MSEYTKNARTQMEKGIDALKNNFTKVRTGRANAHVLDDIKVDYYGQLTPVTQLAGIKVPEASMLVIEPWDKSALKEIEKAIETSDLGITPSNDGSPRATTVPPSAFPSRSPRRRGARSSSRSAASTRRTPRSPSGTPVVTPTTRPTATRS